MLVYSQSTGIMSRDGQPIAKGWAGHGAAKNDPNAQDQVGVGPLPRGLYTLDPWEAVHGELGPMVTHLTPDPGDDEEGRSGFYIHGPASAASGKQGQESKGCIVLWHNDRQAVKDSGETRLQVVA